VTLVKSLPISSIVDLLSHLNREDSKLEPWIKERYLSLYCCVRTASNSYFYD